MYCSVSFSSKLIQYIVLNILCRISLYHVVTIQKNVSYSTSHFDGIIRYICGKADHGKCIVLFM